MRDVLMAEMERLSRENWKNLLFLAGGRWAPGRATLHVPYDGAIQN